MLFRPNFLVGLFAILSLSFLAEAQGSSTAQTQRDADSAIRDKLAAPPLFLDERHPGPTLVPSGMPGGIFPFDCRAVETFLHRVRPGEYHFSRAQRLLGQGIDVIGCEAFGLDRFRQDGGKLRELEQAVHEAEMAMAIPIGLEQWRPGAAEYMLGFAYSEAAKAFANDGKKRNLPHELEKSREYEAKLAALSDVHLDKSRAGRSPLMDAVLRNDPKSVTVLIDSGADVNGTDVDHISALRLAVVTGRFELVKLLLTEGAMPDMADEEGVTALMDACAIGRFDIAAVLIQAGAKINARADDGSGPLLDVVGHISLNESTRKTQRDFAQFLIARGAQVNTADWFGTTPLIRAATTGEDQLAQLLLYRGAEVDAVDINGDNALVHAVQSDSVDSVIILIRGHARLDLLNKRGESALILAAKKGYPDGERITRLLLRAGADPNQATPSGWTALMSAEGFNYKEPWGVSSHTIVRELLGAHAKVNVRSKEGTTPLIVAAGHPGPDDDSFVSELMSAGAQINAADEDGQTALMAAAELGHVRKVRCLLSHGANPKTRDKLGRTALDYARPPRGENDDEFPQCYESIDSSYKKTNDCKATRRVLRVAMQRRY